jgi:Xaa-Pro aminopeptidase
LHAENHPIEEGQIVTIEPGYYKAKAYGIRIENVVEVIKARNCA